MTRQSRPRRAPDAKEPVTNSAHDAREPVTNSAHDAREPVTNAARNAKKLVTATVRAANEDRLTGLAAEVAFFILLSAPPTLLAVLGSVGYIAEAIGPEAADRIQSQIVGAASPFLTPAALSGMEQVVAEFLDTGRAGIIGVGLVIAIWSASRATNAFMRAAAIAYAVREPRSIVKRRLVSLAITVIGILVAVLVIPLVVAGPQLGEALGRPLGLGEAFGTVWRFAYWPGVLAVGVCFLTVIYHIAPRRRTPWRRDLPGAVLAAVLWLGGGAALRLYALVSIPEGGTYGPLAAPIVILLWVYVTSLALLLGAELNAQLEEHWPTDKRRES